MLLVFAAVYLLFALAFGKLLFTHPAPKSETAVG
jgi:hypothetical protein